MLWHRIMPQIIQFTWVADRPFPPSSNHLSIKYTAVCLRWGVFQTFVLVRWTTDWISVLLMGTCHIRVGDLRGRKHQEGVVGGSGDKHWPTRHQASCRLPLRWLQPCCTQQADRGAGNNAYHSSYSFLPCSSVQARVTITAVWPQSERWDLPLSSCTT